MRLPLGWLVLVCRALLHFLDPGKFPDKDHFSAKYKHLLENQSEKEVSATRPFAE